MRHTLLGAVLLTLSCSSPGSAPVKLSAVDVAGCYELESIRWRNEPSGVEKTLFTPPRLFELTLHSFETAPDYYKVENLIPDSKHLFSTWRVENDRQLFINWGTGYVGVSVLAERDARGFRGLAETYTDIQGSAGHQAEISFTPVSCAAVD